jgi:hypothetical protein
MGGYSLNHHGSQQHQLPKHCVNVYCPKKKRILSGGKILKHLRSCNPKPCFSH